MYQNVSNKCLKNQNQFILPTILSRTVLMVSVAVMVKAMFTKRCSVIHYLLADLGYVYTGSDMFRSVWDRIHSVYTGTVLNWNGTVPHRITFISGPIWYQMADPIRTGSARSRVNTRLICTNFVPVPNGPFPCKRCLNMSKLCSSGQKRQKYFYGTICRLVE